ncbi:MAG: YwaF family protein, partial [Clostridia bacterium]|nr:YwaF family protein [Clostridia bacterium]
MIPFLYIASVLLAGGAILLGAELLRRHNVHAGYYMKPLALALSVIAFIAYLWREPAIYNVRGLNMYSPFGDEMVKTVLAVLIYWFSHAGVLIAILSAFFDYKTLRNLAKFAAPITALLPLVFLDTYMTAIIGLDPFAVFDVRHVLLAAQLAITLAISAYHILKDGCTLPTKREWGAFTLALPFAILCLMPTFVPQALLGFVDGSIKIFEMTEAHRFVLYGAIILPILIFHAIREKYVETKRFLMIYFSLGWMWVYLGRWVLANFADPTAWPLHLYNTAMFLVPLCLIFRMQRLFNFCLFINVMGSVLAMIMAEDLGHVNALATMRVSFWLNHYAAFFMPLLLVALKIFKRPKFREWCWAVVSFTVYFVAILFINAWFSNYGSVDYFFLNSDFVVGKLGQWAEDTRDIVVSFKIKDLTFTFYPLYQAIFYVVYVGVFTVGIRFLYEFLFRAWDKAQDRRERERSFRMMKKDLTAFLGGKHINEPISGDSSPRIELKGFCKKYGSNKHYSVHNVSFKVEGGEIFGFLGPNGAGKSTIIKSMVGIQTITEGSIEICGYDVDKQAVQSKMNLGFVPDHYALYENLTGREYINYIADLYRVDAEYRTKTIEKYVERFQLAH